MGSGFTNDVMHAENVDFRGVHPPVGQVTADGQLLIGSAVAPNIRAGTIADGTNISWTAGSGTLQANLSGPPSSTNLTNNGVVIGQGNSPLTATAALTNGQIAIGSTGNLPAAANITSTNGTITITNGPNSIDLASTNNGMNLGISFSAGTFTVLGSDGVTALSTTNPGFVAIPSLVTPGKIIKYTITANQTFTDNAGAGSVNGNLFGFTTGDVQSTDVPFFIYAVGNSAAAASKETAVSFMISRQAGRRLSPVAGSIGKTGSSIADDEWSFFALGNPTVADYASSPCVMIGSFRMTKIAASDGWVVSTLGAQDGIGQFQEQQQFSLSTGVLGAKSGSHWKNNGGTAPTFNSQSFLYMMQPDGWINAFVSGTTASVNGAGAVTASVILPMRGGYQTNFPIQTSGVLQTTATSTLMPIISGSLAAASMYFVNNAADGTLLNSVLGAAVVGINVNFYYYPKVA